MPRIVIASGIAGHPLAAAGNSWAFLQYILGFRELGWHVWVVESLDPAKLIGPDWKPAAPGASANEAHWQATLERFGLPPEQATLFIGGRAPNAAAARAFAATADVFLNISGHFPMDLLDFPAARKVYLDLDPAFTQIWADTYQVDMNFSGHDVFFSVGTRLGRDGCRAPTCGRTWHGTVPPVVLSHWPEQPPVPFSRLTTVAHWQGYKWCEWQGAWYTGKSEQFTKLRELPRLTPVPLEIATEASINREELAPFREAGWRLTESAEVCATFDAYEAYIRGSAGEFSAAKGGYVLSQCGWFSDRTVCYLASGRPAIVERTGLPPEIPTGAGLHDFATPEEAAAACDRVRTDHASACRAARQLAEELFDSRRVLPAVLERI